MRRKKWLRLFQGKSSRAHVMTSEAAECRSQRGEVRVIEHKHTAQRTVAHVWIFSFFFLLFFLQHTITLVPTPAALRCRSSVCFMTASERLDGHALMPPRSPWGFGAGVILLCCILDINRENNKAEADNLPTVVAQRCTQKASLRKRFFSFH